MHAPRTRSVTTRPTVSPVDLDYLRANPHLLPTFIEHQRIRFTPVSSGPTGVAQRLTFDDGNDVFAKLSEDGPFGIIEAEARSLEWLAEAGAPVPRLWCSTDTLLVTDWLPPAEPTVDAAVELGRHLALMHRSGAEGYGAPWDGFIGALPLDNSPVDGRQSAEPDDWAEWFVLRRLEPYLKLSRDNGALDTTDAFRVGAAAGRIRLNASPPESIARLHGDLWPGNLHWSTDRCWLIDPAAHGGHRESDLAQLFLFGGAPHLDLIVTGYQEVWPLADGWRDRIPMHQLHLLLVHTALFGSGYRGQVMAAVDAIL